MGSHRCTEFSGRKLGIDGYTTYAIGVFILRSYIDLLMFDRYTLTNQCGHSGICSEYPSAQKSTWHKLRLPRGCDSLEHQWNSACVTQNDCELNIGDSSSLQGGGI